jgi:hypothetical protein
LKNEKANQIFKKGIKHLKWKIQNMSVIFSFKLHKKILFKAIINYTFEDQYFYELMCLMNMLICVAERACIVHNSK